MKQVKELVKLKQQKDELEAQKKLLNEAYEKVEQQVLDYFAEQGMQSANVDGHTVYLSRQFSAKSNENTIELLKDSEFSWLIKEQVNSRTAASAVREAMEESGELPEILTQAFDVKDFFRANVKKS